MGQLSDRTIGRQDNWTTGQLGDRTIGGQDNWAMGQLGDRTIGDDTNWKQESWTGQYINAKRKIGGMN